MHKKAFLACMLVVTMLLTGCALIEKDEAVDRATEVVRVSNSAGGEDIVYTKGEVLDEVNYQLNYMSYLYSMLGYSYDPTDPTIIAQTKDDVMDMLVEDAVETLKAQELGLNEFTEEELAEIAESVDTDWESNKSSLQSQEFADTELTGDELDAALSSVSEQADAIREGMKTAEKRMKELQKLIEYGKNYTEYKPIHDELKKLKNGWTSKRDKYEEAHRAELTLWNAASRYLHANLPKGTKSLPIAEWEKEYATLSGQRTAEYTKLKETRAEVAELHNIRKCVDIALKADQPEQTRTKQHDLER